jgi:DMSO/TMAO reductase YedYZ heme-binding membrane subunit
MNELWWYTARAAGIVAYALLSASVILGLALTTRALGRHPRPAWLLDLHRFLGGLATVFVGVHLLALVADDYVTIRLIDLVVPFASSWRPSAVAWGVVALWLLVAVEVTSLVRARLPRRVWRYVHAGSFPLFFIATFHVVFAGTDSSAPIMRFALIAAVTAVLGLTMYRVWQLDAEPASDVAGARR